MDNNEQDFNQPIQKKNNRPVVIAVAAAVVVVVAVVLCVIFLGGKGKDKGETGESAPSETEAVDEIVGTWELILFEENGEKYDPSSTTFKNEFGETTPIIVFKEDGTFTPSTSSRDGTWEKRSEGVYKLVYNGDTYTDDYDGKLEGDTLIAGFVDGDYKVSLTFKRVSDDEKASEAETVDEIVGTWQLSCYEEDGKEYAADSEEVKYAFGSDLPKMEIAEDGTLAAFAERKSTDGTWKNGTGNEYLITVYGEEESWTLENGTLIYKSGTSVLTFERIADDEKASESEPAPSETEPASEDASAAGIEGSWVLVGYEEDGKRYDAGTPEFEAKFNEIKMDIAGDGSFSIVVNGETSEGTWESKTGNEYLLTARGDPQTFTLEGGKLIARFDKEAMIFEKK